MTTLDSVLDEKRHAARRLSIGTQFVQAPEFVEWRRRGGHRASGSWRSPVVEVIAPPDMRSAVLDGAGLTFGEVVSMQSIPPVPTVASRFAQGRTTANAIQYPYDPTPPVAVKAATTAPGAAKAALTPSTLQMWTQPVTKQAGYITVSDEQFEDVPGLASYIDARLTRAVDLAIDADLIATISALPGLTPSYAAGTASSAAALLRQAMVVYTTSGYLPDTIVLHPNAWWAVFAVTGQELQGAFPPAYPPVGRWVTLYLYGMMLVPSLAVPTPTTAIVGDFDDAAQMFWRDEYAIEASNSHNDNFTKNMVTLRGERRYALATYSQKAFGLVTGLPVLT
jgi:HK97 family phage major capsid protein